MLRREQRLTRSAFNIARRSPLVCSDRNVSFRFSCIEGMGRFSVVVSKSIVARATKRNLMRRRIYGLLSGRGEGIKGIMYLRSGTPSFDELSSSVQKLLSEAGRSCGYPT